MKWYSPLHTGFRDAPVPTIEYFEVDVCYLFDEKQFLTKALEQWLASWELEPETLS